VRVTDLAAVESALSEGEGDLRDRLQEAGATGAIDAARSRDLVAAARAVADLAETHLEGPTGVGRSRFALVVAGAKLADWAASFPRNPFSVPVALDLAGSGPELSCGLLRGLLQRGLEEERRVRSARLLLEDSPDRAQREVELRNLSWQELMAAEPAAAPTLLVLGDPSSLLGEGAAGLSRLLRSELPIKVLLLDDGSAEETEVDPVLLGLAHRRAFVLSASVGHEEHLMEGLSQALEFAGPALIRIHAPSPRRDGFATEATVARAREAVRCRVAPLLRYDPREEGVFGTRLSLAGNPDPGEDWASDEDGRALTPADWAVGAGRWAAGFGSSGSDGLPVADWLALLPAERSARHPEVTAFGGMKLRVPSTVAGLAADRAETWKMLQELAGLVTPFTGAVRAHLEEEISVSHRAEVDSLVEAHQHELRGGESQARTRQAAALTDRLLRLAGYSGDSEPGR